jgi:hypothetical protein
MARELKKNHLEMYKSKGKYRKLFEVIQEDSELSFEIRKNDVAMVYYRKKKILTIERGKKINLLDKKYVGDLEEYQKLYQSYNFNNSDNLKSKDCIKKYFKKAKKYAYKHDYGIEFEFQQNILRGNSSYSNRYMVVDMEWAFSQANIDKDERICKTRIDLLVVDTELNSNGYNDIYMAELKVGNNAQDGKSGIRDHIKKNDELINHPLACEALRNDVINIVEQKRELGILDGTPKELKFVDGQKPKTMLVLAYRNNDEYLRFVDEVRAYEDELKVIYYDMNIKLF